LAAPVVFSWSMLAKTQSEGFLASEPLVFAGEVSFAFYLAHMPLLVAYKGIAAEMRGIDSGFYMVPWELAGLLLVTVLVSVALHMFVERPGRSAIRRWFEKRDVRPVAISE
jgi:peptidoglycan/LPS O-acetylase OafA/YrhL